MTLALTLASVLAAPDGDSRWDGPNSLDITAAATRRTLEEAERVLVQCIQEGDGDAFRTVMEAHFTRAAKFAFAFVHERDAAEDIAQDVFARIWSNRAMWDPHTSVRSYILGAVRHRALDVLKHRGVEARYAASENEQGEANGAIASEQLEHAAELAMLERAVAELPERRRIALMLRYEMGLAHAEVGTALGVSAKAAKELVVRTLDALRVRLREMR